jgi:insertion element IS1 protein InsB
MGRNHYCCCIYIIYAINKDSRRIVDYVIGRKNKENTGKLVNKLMALSPKRIYTDKLNIFAGLIPSSIHRSFRYRTNRIERKNLTLRTHLKRLSRKTICFSKSIAMLEACLRLYLWKEPVSTGAIVCTLLNRITER